MHFLQRFKELRIAYGIVGGGAQLVHIVDFAGDIVGDAAAAIGDLDVFVDDGHVGIRHEPLAAAGRLGTQGNAADNQDFLCHDRLSL